MKRRKCGASRRHLVHRVSWLLLGLRVVLDLVRWVANWPLS
jgi:hypothetical protein